MKELASNKEKKTQLPHTVKLFWIIVSILIFRSISVRPSTFSLKEHLQKKLLALFQVHVDTQVKKTFSSCGAHFGLFTNKKNLVSENLIKKIYLRQRKLHQNDFFPSELENQTRERDRDLRNRHHVPSFSALHRCENLWFFSLLNAN